MTDVKVFEDPRPKNPSRTELEKVAVQHVQVAEFLLKLMPYFPVDENGLVTNEALVYSEWRYIVYLRFLHTNGFSPHERPPPWDVAMIMYCHLLSPANFHAHLAGAGLTNYGLVHFHYPLSELLKLIKKQAWSHRKAQRDWEKFNKSAGYDLPYQIWQPAEPEKSGLSRLFGRSSDSEKAHRLSKISDGMDQSAEEKPIRMPVDSNGGIYCGIHPPSSWSLGQYAHFRTRGLTRNMCQQHQNYERDPTKCELEPWPAISNLKSELYAQCAFWSALEIASRDQPDFLTKLHSAINDYINWITSISLLPSRYHTEELLDQLFQKSDSVTRLIPPSLEVDLLWHTHRLFPGCYWSWCDLKNGHLVDGQPVSRPEVVRIYLKETRGRMQKVWRSRWPVKNEISTLLGTYTPEAAVLAPLDAAKRSKKVVMFGHLYQRRVMRCMYCTDKRFGRRGVVNGWSGSNYNGSGDAGYSGATYVGISSYYYSYGGHHGDSGGCGYDGGYGGDGGGGGDCGGGGDSGGGGGDGGGGGGDGGGGG